MNLLSFLYILHFFPSLLTLDEGDLFSFNFYDLVEDLWYIRLFLVKIDLSNSLVSILHGIEVLVILLQILIDDPQSSFFLNDQCSAEDTNDHGRGIHRTV